MKTTELKRGEKFWCWWMSRSLRFVRAYEHHDTGTTLYEFEDAIGARFELIEAQVAKLDRRD